MHYRNILCGAAFVFFNAALSMLPQASIQLEEQEQARMKIVRKFERAMQKQPETIDEFMTEAENMERTPENEPYYRDHLHVVMRYVNRNLWNCSLDSPQDTEEHLRFARFIYRERNRLLLWPSLSFSPTLNSDLENTLRSISTHINYAHVPDYYLKESRSFENNPF